jgi:mono/diheme cytochrome c family protein
MGDRVAIHEPKGMPMRSHAAGMLMLAAAGCTARGADSRHAEATVVPAAVAFDGADYSNQADKVAHGKRLATLFTCNGCHGADYSGQDFGVAFPIVKGLWASNISRQVPGMSDAQLERLLREGVHPDREIYVMPSKQTQFLSARDMTALIAFLRTIPPVGKATPVPPPGFEAAVTARLPDDYWLTLQDGEKHNYHNAAEEVVYYAAHQPPDLGPQLARGRMIASSICSSCHGAALDGLGEPAGDIQGALGYDDTAFDRLLIESIDRTGKRVAVEWGFGHEVQPLSAGERRDVIAYARALARSRERRP